MKKLLTLLLFLINCSTQIHQINAPTTLVNLGLKDYFVKYMIIDVKPYYIYNESDYVLVYYDMNKDKRPDYIQGTRLANVELKEKPIINQKFDVEFTLDDLDFDGNYDKYTRRTGDKRFAAHSIEKFYEDYSFIRLFDLKKLGL